MDGEGVGCAGSGCDGVLLGGRVRGGWVGSGMLGILDWGVWRRFFRGGVWWMIFSGVE